MTTKETIAETAAKVLASVQAAGLVHVCVNAANGRVYLEADSRRVADLRKAVESARPVLLASGRKVTWITTRGHKFFRVGHSGITMCAAFSLDMSEEELNSVLLGRHNMGTTFPVKS